jgi:hypothetical protein
MIHTTLNAIRAHGPCADGWKKLLTHLGKTEADDEPLPLVTVLNSNGLDDALWCLRSVPDAAPAWRMYAVWCAWQVRHLMKDSRSLKVLEVARDHALGLVTDKELAAARDAAWAAWAVAGVAGTVALAAWAAAWTAALAARAAARAAAEAAAEAAEKEKQKDMLRRVFTCPTIGEAVYMMLGELK